MTSTGFLATVKEMSALEERLVHLVREPGSGVEVGELLRLAPERGGCCRRSGTKES